MGRLRPLAFYRAAGLIPWFGRVMLACSCDAPYLNAHHVLLRPFLLRPCLVKEVAKVSVRSRFLNSFAALSLIGAPAYAADLEGSGAVLQGLDKVTARISPIHTPINETVRFGTLEITVRRCLKRPPEEPPESAALMDIREVRPGEEPVVHFSGWMFASSPALNALEHPVYDVWVKDCLNASSPAANGPK